MTETSPEDTDTTAMSPKNYDTDVMLEFALLFDLDIARRMLQAGAYVNHQRDGSSHLHCTALNNSVPAAQLLIEFGANVSFFTDHDKKAPLHIASEKPESYDMCKLLLTNGATCNGQDKHGTTPFLNVLKRHNMDYVRLFLAHRANVKAVDHQGKTALHYAAQNPDADVIRFVLEQGLDINCSDGENYSPLHHAALNGFTEGCKFLLKRGAMVDKTGGQDGHTPVSLVVLRSECDCTLKTISRLTRNVQVLLESGAKVDHKVGDLSILDIGSRSNVHECMKNILIRHVAKMQFLGLQVAEEDLQTIENNEYYNKYYHRCLQEIGRIRKRKADKKISINDWCSSSSVISEYVRDKGPEKASAEIDTSAYEAVKEKFYVEIRKRGF